MLISRRRRGRCLALRWDVPAAQYRCGALAAPPPPLRWLPRAASRWLVARWIGAGSGCDADLDAIAAPAPPAADPAR
jgi:hypothetical protein